MKPIKVCFTCDKRLSKNAAGSYCNSHRDRSGINNPFYGKKHKPISEETRLKQSESSKKKWQDPTYRQKVIAGTSKPRHANFKKEQSERILQWYQDNPEQRALRGQHMANTWRLGKITAQSQSSHNSSNIEKEFVTRLRDGGLELSKITIHNNGSWYFPDALLSGRDKILIEFLGDYWHANPREYSASDIVHHSLTAADIWLHDSIRCAVLEKAGYTVYEIWESDYTCNKNQTVDFLVNLFDWDACSF